MTTRIVPIAALVLALSATLAAAELPPALMAPFDPPPRRVPSADAEEAILQRVANARAEASRDNKWVLLEFTASWCEDCQEVARIAALPGPAAVIARRYVRVRIDVGDRFDGAPLLADHFDVEALSHWVVIDERGRRVAGVTLQPRFHQLRLTPEAFAGWLGDPSDIPPPMRRDASIRMPDHAPTRDARRASSPRPPASAETRAPVPTAPPAPQPAP